MSKGNRIFKVRLSQEVETAMMDAIKKRNENTRKTPWVTSEFIRAAILEKLLHMGRSRKRRAKRDSLAGPPCPRCGKETEWDTGYCSRCWDAVEMEQGTLEI